MEWRMPVAVVVVLGVTQTKLISFFFVHVTPKPIKQNKNNNNSDSVYTITWRMKTTLKRRKRKDLSHKNIHPQSTHKAAFNIYIKHEERSEK